LNSDPAKAARPAARYRMPAEWAPHAATWLSWPHNHDTWPGLFAAVEPAFCAIVAALAVHETVRINVQDESHARHVQKLLRGLAPADAFVTHLIPTDDAWIRDHGAIFVHDDARNGGLVALDFAYNAWGGKYSPFNRDAQVAERMGKALDVPVEAFEMVLEGGSLDVDGAGSLLTTEQCLLNPNRNPALSRADIEQRLREYFGVTDIFWLGEGIEGDDTDGHIDDLSRFVTPGIVVTVIERDSTDPNYAPLAENRRRLDRLAASQDGRLEVVELPMPPPLYNDGERLPASYANFYVANEIVLMPAFDCPQDSEAMDILAACFAGRRIVPVDCRALVAGLGALHCLTQQVPAIVARPSFP
jgi:agmatine deiminase